MPIADLDCQKCVYGDGIEASYWVGKFFSVYQKVAKMCEK